MSNPNPVPNELTADNAALVRAGDTIRPKKSPGETWMVAGVYSGGTVMNAGWPSSLLYSDEYSIERRCSDQEHEEMLRRCARIVGDDSRRSLAIEVLQKMGKLPPTPPTPLEAANLRIKELEEKLAKAEKDAFRRGAECAASEARTYNGCTSHPYDLGDCILGKLNLSDTLRNNGRANDALKADLDKCEKLEKENAELRAESQRLRNTATLMMQKRDAAGQERDALREQVGKARAALEAADQMKEWAHALVRSRFEPKHLRENLCNAANRYNAARQFIGGVLAALPSPSCPKCVELEQVRRATERMEELLTDQAADLGRECYELDARCKGMEEALKFYADFAVYEQRTPEREIVVDRGHRARAALATISLPNSKWSSTPTPEKEKVPAECAKCEEAKRVVTSLYRAADTVIEKATLGMGGVFLVHVDVFNALHDAVIQTPIQDYDIADDNAGHPVESPPPAKPCEVNSVVGPCPNVATTEAECASGAHAFVCDACAQGVREGAYRGWKIVPPPASPSSAGENGGGR